MPVFDAVVWRVASNAQDKKGIDTATYRIKYEEEELIGHGDRILFVTIVYSEITLIRFQKVKRCRNRSRYGVKYTRRDTRYKFYRRATAFTCSKTLSFSYERKAQNFLRFLGSRTLSYFRTMEKLRIFRLSAHLSKQM